MQNEYQNIFAKLIDSITVLDFLPDTGKIIVSSVVAALVFFHVIAVFALIAIYAERKIAGHMQDRLGPMETGWHGVLQTLADAVKLLLKEDLIPGKADRRLFVLAPFIVFMSALAVFVVFPFSESIIVSDINIGILYVIAISTVVVPGIIMAGWSSNNKWSLFGAMRSAAQIVSYEIPVGLAIVCAIMVSGSMSMQTIVQVQSGGFWNWIIFNSFPFNFIAAIIYFCASVAEINRTPFDIPEAESELVAGYMTEYSGMRWSFFFLAEYGNLLAVSAIGTTLFLGGWQAPIDALAFVPGVVWFLSKTAVLVFVQIWIRWTLPRLRVDQLMYVCWKVFVPLALICIAGVGLWQVL
jgi:NADH-quinone oxidoreductase subunit H